MQQAPALTVLNDGKWQGSDKTASMVKRQIIARWGEAEAANYHPLKNCFTFKTWEAKGYHVNKGEKALKAISVLRLAKDKDAKEEEVLTRKRLVNLFYIKQVTQVKQ